MPSSGLTDLIEIDEMPSTSARINRLTDLLPGVELRYSYGDGDFIWQTKVRIIVFVSSKFFLRKVQATVKCVMQNCKMYIDPMLLQLPSALEICFKTHKYDSVKH